MNKKISLIIAATGLLLLCTTVQAGRGGKGGGKADPQDCPCYQEMVDLTAQAECTTYHALSKVGKGRTGITRTLLWHEWDYPDPATEPDAEATLCCGILSASSIRDEALAAHGEADGSSCYLPDPRDEWDHRCLDVQNYCLKKGLTAKQVDACDLVVKASARDIEDLPECPPPEE